MSNIRRLNIFDKKQLKEIAGSSSLNSDYFKYNLMKECACSAQSFLPLQYKFMPESYVYNEAGQIRGMISTCPTRGNSTQINISRLLFANNDYYIGKELIDYIIHHYAELGAKTFKVIIDNNHKDLEQLFMNGCGFRCGSWENLWDISHNIEKLALISPIEFQPANDEHAHAIAELINSELVPYYRPTLEHHENEFKEPLLKIFDNRFENNYVLTSDKHVVAYLSIQTNDNYNFIISLIKNNGYALDYNAIVSFAINSIKKRRCSEFRAYLKQKKYLKFAQEYEDYLHANQYDCVQTQHLLVKEFYRPIKQEFKAFVFSENKLFSN